MTWRSWALAHRSTRRVCWIAVALACWALAGAPAYGDDDTNKERAVELFKEGLRLSDRSNYRDACPLFERSLALYPGVGTRGRLAECYEKIGRVASAYQLYLLVEELSRDAGNTTRADEAARRAGKLEPRLSRLNIEPDLSSGVTGLQVTQNGRVVEPRTFGTNLLVDPGNYRIKAEAPGYQTWTREVTIAEGRSVTLEIPALTRLGAGESGQSESSLAVDRRGRVVGFVLMGGGAAGLLTSLYFGRRAQSAWGEISEACKNETMPCAQQDRRNQVKADSNATRATYIAVAGGALLVAGAVTWWLKRGSKSSESDRTVRIAPVVTPDQVGVTLRLRL